MRVPAPLLSAALSSSLLLLTACGGGGGAAAPGATTALPATSTTTTSSGGSSSAGTPTSGAQGSTGSTPETGTPTTTTPTTTPAETPVASTPAAPTTPVETTPSTPPAAAPPTSTQRALAAAATAESADNACGAIRPFYWEVGDRDARLASGSVNAAGSSSAVTGDQVLAIASASKWVYGAYVAQVRGGVLSAEDQRFLSLRAGYVSLASCDVTQTVDGCLASKANGAYTAAADGKFDYNGGHLQKHASLMGLGALNSQALTAAVQAQIGTDVALQYTRAQPAGGLNMSADAYARMLRKMLGGELLIGQLLGSGAVCTNPISCGYDQALYTPTPAGESWHYTAGHWVEDDPLVGDGAFSSGGAFGFYPWIDATKTSYGIVARSASNGGTPSALCGRLIRKAWASGVAL